MGWICCYADSMLVVKDLRSTSDHVQILHMIHLALGKWEGILSITLNILGQHGSKKLWPRGLRTWAVTDCAHLIPCH